MKKLRWAAIGHSEQPGVFTVDGREISILPEHIRISQEHPETIFEVIELRRPGGLSSYSLGGWPPPEEDDDESGEFDVRPAFQGHKRTANQL